MEKENIMMVSFPNYESINMYDINNLLRIALFDSSS